jgi:hypothetical protein
VVHWRQNEAVSVSILVAMDATPSATTIHAPDVLPLFLLEVGPPVKPPLENDDA